jgi:fucose 4-O-acetylase-like acetyltransferase
MPAEIKDSSRVAWIDCCKGICIVLVVYGHVAGGLEATDTIKPGSIFIGVREWIYLFHMPVFFFLSGLFARKACTRPFGEFLLGRLKTLAYPYVVWTWIILASQLAMVHFVNNPPDLPKALRFLFEPYGYGMWFLYSLFLISLVFFGLSRLRLPPIAVALVGLVLYLLSMHDAVWFWPILNTAMAYAIFFLLGACFPGIASAPLKNAPLPILFTCAAVMFAAMTLLQTMHSDPSGLLKLVMACLGVLGAVCLAMAVVRTVAGGVCAFAGIYSLEIYVAHPLWGTAARALLLRCGAHTPWIFVFCGVLLGVTGSLAMGVLCQRYGFPYLFRWPAKKARVEHQKQVTGDKAKREEQREWSADYRGGIKKLKF